VTSPPDVLAAARDRVYAVPPDGFTAERARLVQELRDQGRRGAAADVQKLRRPSLAAWSVNQAARAEPERVAQLFAAGEVLGQAHREAVSGRAGATVRDAGQRRRALVDDLTRRALEFAALLSPNPEPHRDAIEATWAAASVDPSVQPAVASGWLAKELPRPTGFALGATPPASAPVARPKPRRDELAVRRARAALDVAREELEIADGAVASAERSLRSAETAGADAARRVADLEAALATARDAARAAGRETRSAGQAVTRARASRDRARRGLDKADRSLREVEGQDEDAGRKR